MADPRLKTIKIKTGVVKRMTKEKVVYEREAKEQKEKIEKLKLAGNDEYDIKKQEEVLTECLMMVPDCRRRYVCFKNFCYDDSFFCCKCMNHVCNYLLR